MIELEHERVKTYVLAGNATITLQSGKTGKHFTYRIKKHKENHDLYFIYSLVGEDNTKDYRYIGCYFTDNRYLHLYLNTVLSRTYLVHRPSELLNSCSKTWIIFMNNFMYSNPVDVLVAVDYLQHLKALSEDLVRNVSLWLWKNFWRKIIHEVRNLQTVEQILYNQ